MSARLPQHRFIFITLVAITFISPLANHMFIPAMPLVKQEFQIGDELAFATLSLTMMTMAFTSIVYGGISDEWGRKRVLLSGLALYTIGAEICWFAPNIEMLLGGRMLQGAGAGCGIVLARAIARDVYGMEKISAVIANLTAAYVLGPLLAPVIGSYLVGWEGWRFLFIPISVIGLVLIGIVYFGLPETHAPVREKPPFSVIVRNILRNYFQLLKVPRFAAYALMPGCLSGVFFANAAASAFLAIETLGISTRDFGHWFLWMPAGFMLGNLISGQIGNRLSIGMMTIGGASLCLLIVAFQWFWNATAGLSIGGIMIPGAMLGIAQGMCMPYAQTGAMRVNPALAGSASGAVVFSQLFLAGAAEQSVGFLSDGTLIPVLYVMFGFSCVALTAAIFAEISRARNEPAA
ncbi:MAG: Bcr/CflA family efflux MFS transporter [Alphaproteobacteria bacterium]|nr:Bcr/CflA family efflux MFS transporter [Alphaproteobacteria bacterium]